MLTRAVLISGRAVLSGPRMGPTPARLWSRLCFGRGMQVDNGSLGRLEVLLDASKGAGCDAYGEAGERKEAGLGDLGAAVGL